MAEIQAKLLKGSGKAEKTEDAVLCFKNSFEKEFRKMF